MIPASPLKAFPFLFGLLFVFVAFCGPAHAGDEEFERTGVTLKEGVDYPIPMRGTGQFLGIGRIDNVDMDNQVIAVDDATYFLMPSTDYYTSVMGAGSIHLFREGQDVGFIANRKREILSLWLIE